MHFIRYYKLFRHLIYEQVCEMFITEMHPYKSRQNGHTSKLKIIHSISHKLGSIPCISCFKYNPASAVNMSLNKTNLLLSFLAIPVSHYEHPVQHS